MSGIEVGRGVFQIFLLKLGTECRAQVCTIKYRVWWVKVMANNKALKYKGGGGCGCGGKKKTCVWDKSGSCDLWRTTAVEFVNSGEAQRLWSGFLFVCVYMTVLWTKKKVMQDFVSIWTCIKEIFAQIKIYTNSAGFAQKSFPVQYFQVVIRGKI